jgi:hypothetical protein
MKKISRRVLGLVFCLGILGLMVSYLSLHGGVPQTITVDGSNDFLPANVLDIDGYDCQHVEIDIDTVYVTNDLNKLYIGFYYNKGVWTQNQLGIMFAVGDTAGGTTDAWGHAIAWNTTPTKPDYQAWCNMDNSWQELRVWNSGTSSWDVQTSGTGSLGWVNNTGFEELGIDLTDLGLSIGDTVCIEIVSTQNGGTKGPLDCIMNDGDQLSRPSGTTWDVGAPVELDSMYCYVVQSAIDSIPPVVVSVEDPGGTSLVEAGIDDFLIVYSEPVDKTSAENAGNYTLHNTSASIDSAVQVPGSPEKVRIYLDSTIIPADTARGIEATNVKDIWNNTIVDNDSSNVGCFYLKGVLFRGLMGLHLSQHSFPTDTFTVEGGLDRLTWGGCDNGFMTHVGGDVYEVKSIFILDDYDGDGVGDPCDPAPYAVYKVMEWKFMHQCVEYEPRPNRVDTIRMSEGPWDTLEAWWNDEGPDLFTAHPIDVIFHVDVNIMSPGADSIVAINGSVSPLTFDVPSITNMADDGNPPDDTADDGIYVVTVRFPAISFKNVEYKYLYNDRYECMGLANRGVWLNDAVYDTVGGTLGPIEMPVQYYDRCGVTGRAVEVVFMVDACGVQPGGNDTISVNGTPNNQSPQVINWNVPSINPMRDDGVYPDTLADDHIYAVSIVFPDSSDYFVEYKYLFNSAYECTAQANRYFSVDETFDATGNPQMLELDVFNSCFTDVPEDVPSVTFTLHQNFPNPFNPVTTILFTMPFDGRAVLRIYNVKGELVATLLDGFVREGEKRLTWDGRDDHGGTLSSGVYFYELRTGEYRSSRKMILLR